MPTSVFIDGSGTVLAPGDAKFLVQTANASLPNAQAMGALATGLVKNTTTTGVQSIGVAGTDYMLPITQQYATPTTGTTVAMTDSAYTQLILNPAGTLAALTVQLPASPAANNSYMAIATTQAITTLTVDGNGHSIVTAPTTLAAGGAGLKFVYASTPGLWVRCN